MVPGRNASAWDGSGPRAAIGPVNEGVTETGTISSATMQHFSDLVTVNGLKTFPAMSPKDTDLAGSHTGKGPLTTTWTWKFKADVK